MHLTLRDHRRRRLTRWIVIVAVIVLAVAGIRVWRGRSPELDRLKRDVAFTWSDPRLTLQQETRKKKRHEWLWNVNHPAKITRTYAIVDHADPYDVLLAYQRFLRGHGYEPEPIIPSGIKRWHLLAASESSGHETIVEAAASEIEQVFTLILFTQ